MWFSLDMARSPAQLVRFVEEALPVTLVDTWTGPDWTGARFHHSPLPGGERVPAARNGLSISPRTAGRLYLAEGWSAWMMAAVRYATRPNPALLLDLPDGGGVLTLQTFGPAPLVGLRLAGAQNWVVATGAGGRGDPSCRPAQPIAPWTGWC